VAEGRQSKRGSRGREEPRLAGSAAALSLSWRRGCRGSTEGGSEGGEKGEGAPASAP
jgi:hypothetical protein